MPVKCVESTFVKVPKVLKSSDLIIQVKLVSCHAWSEVNSRGEGNPVLPQSTLDSNLRGNETGTVLQVQHDIGASILHC